MNHPLMFGKYDDSISIHELLLQGFRAEHELLRQKLGNTYTNHVGRVGLDTDSGHAVQILDPYTDLPQQHEKRMEWCRLIEKCSKHSDWERIPFLVYYLGSGSPITFGGKDKTDNHQPERAPKLALIEQFSFALCSRNAKETELIPHEIQRKMAMEERLTQDEQEILNMYRELVQAKAAGKKWRPWFVAADPEQSFVDRALQLRDRVDSAILSNVSPMRVSPHLNKNSPDRLLNAAISIFWPDDGVFYPGVVVDVRRDTTFLKVLYDDDDEEWIPSEEQKYRFKDEKTKSKRNAPPKARVTVYWKEELNYFSGTVIAVRFQSTFHKVHYDDGKAEWLPLEEHRYRIGQKNNKSVRKHMMPDHWAMVNKDFSTSTTGKGKQQSSSKTSFQSRLVAKDSCENDIVLDLSSISTENDSSSHNSSSFEVAPRGLRLSSSGNVEGQRGDIVRCDEGHHNRSEGMAAANDCEQNNKASMVLLVHETKNDSLQKGKRFSPIQHERLRKTPRWSSEEMVGTAGVAPAYEYGQIAEVVREDASSFPATSTTQLLVSPVISKSVMRELALLSENMSQFRTWSSS